MAEIRTGNADALILCGGLGTRFRVVREDIPKALAPVQGTPFIDLLLDDLIAQGFLRIILATGYLGNQIEHHVKQRKDAEYIISNEPKPLGTGGAVKFAEKYFSSDKVLILNGDSRITVHFPSLLKFHKNYEADMTLLLSSAKRGKDYGNVKLNEENRITSFLEKPAETNFQLINAGVYCLNHSLLKGLDPEVEYSIEKDWLPTWIHSHRIFWLQTNQTFYDIGTSECYRAMQSRL